MFFTIIWLLCYFDLTESILSLSSRAGVISEREKGSFKQMKAANPPFSKDMAPYSDLIL